MRAGKVEWGNLPIGDNIDRLLVMDVTDLGWVWTHHTVPYTLHLARQGNKRSVMTFSMKPPLLCGAQLWDTEKSSVWMLPYKPKWCWHFTTVLETRAEVNRLVQKGSKGLLSKMPRLKCVAARLLFLSLCIIHTVRKTQRVTSKKSSVPGIYYLPLDQTLGKSLASQCQNLSHTTGRWDANSVQ